jgi:hypothetical protein
VSYDSTEDTQAHIGAVQELLEEVIGDLRYRSAMHDGSKLQEPEKAMFDRVTPLLRDSTYGSDEYKEFLRGMGEGLRHHYEVNDHHPEHWTADGRQGIAGMSLMAIMEMLTDWKAATLRHADGDLRRSIEQNQERFFYTDEVKMILLHTAEDLGWV